MYAKLTGRIDTLESNKLIVDVNGVGYLISASARTLGMIGQVGDQTSLLIETVVREDHIGLFGFADQLEKEWFNMLCTVQGVGAKAALAILAVIPPEELSLVISAEDKAVVSRADGVGPKLATRIVTELKEKAGKMIIGNAVLSDNAKGDINGTAKVSVAGIKSSVSGDAISALINLGYGRSEAFEAVTTVSRHLGDNANDVQALIRESLKELSA